MASQKRLSNKMADSLERLANHRQEFVEKVSTQGYSRRTIITYEQTARHFCDEIRQRGLHIDTLDALVVEALFEAVIEKAYKSSRNLVKFCLGRFIEHLVDAGVMIPVNPAPKELTELERLCEEYKAYLRYQRGLSEATIESCTGYVGRFMAFRFGETLGDFNAITSEDIVSFISQLKGGPMSYRQKVLPSRLRNLFNFLFWSGKTERDLSKGIPRVIQKRPDLPRHLKPEDIQRLIEAVRTDDTKGRRNYAMLLLMARLGLRATEVIAIQIDDIDWRSGEILIRGKGKLHDRMPLPADVGEAMVSYIKNGRVGISRALFVSSRAPHKPFKDSQMLGTILRNAFKKIGRKPPHKFIGSHLFRHSLATDMLRKGASLDEISDVLRHRSRQTTMIYAKYDIDALRSIARAWPVRGGA
jgi:integrase/recombinase XerD